jgi:hypothetical protein
MARNRRALDGQAGALPDIRTDTAGITFIMAPLGAPPGERLMIRCDVDDEIRVSIRSEDVSGPWPKDSGFAHSLDRIRPADDPSEAHGL